MMTDLLISKGFDRKDGIGRASQELYTHLSRIRKIEKLDLQRFSGRHSNPLMQYLGKLGEKRALALIKIINPRVLHALAPDHASLLRYRARLRVLTWHDMVLYERLAERNGLLLGMKYKEKTRLWREAYANTDVIIDVSTKTKRLRERRFGRKKSYVIQNGISEDFLREKVWHGERKDFVYIGSVEYRNKNMAGLLALMDMLKAEKEKPKLHIFTATSNTADYIPKRNDVILHKNATDAEIIQRLRKSVALLHLATSEGFGIPILESQAVGTPTLIYSSANITEEVKRYAFGGDTLTSLRDEAVRLMHRGKPLEREKVRYARSFTWDRTARLVNEVYERNL